jgi:hypothetical protein
MHVQSNRRPLRGAAAVVATALLAYVANADPTASPPRDPKAMAAVERMAAAIVAAPALSVDGEIAWDVVQADGQALEFGARRELVMKRPDRLRVDLVLREGGERRFFYDGKQVVLHDPTQNVYAAVERTGPVFEVAQFVGGRLGIPVALAELLSPDLAAKLGEKVDSASWIATETIDGVETEHVTLHNEVGGMQLWIGTKDALPRRIAIRYEHEEGHPQFRARFTDWDLSPRVSDSAFEFDPPEGVEKIEFARRGQPQKKETPK